MSAGDWKRFYQAVCDGDMRLVRHYIEAGIDVNYAHPEFFSTPLVAAIRNQREEVALFILQRGADPLRVSEVDGASPMALMARSNSPTLGHPKFPQAGPPDYDDSGATAMRAAASLRR